MKKFFVLIILFSLCCLSLDSQQYEFGDVVSSCQRQKKYNNVCNMIFELQDMQNEMLFNLRKTVQIGDYENIVAAAADIAATGRVRLRTKSLVLPEINQIIDMHKDGSVIFLLEKNF